MFLRENYEAQSRKSKYSGCEYFYGKQKCVEEIRKPLRKIRKPLWKVEIRRKRKAVDKIGKPLKKIFSDFLETGKLLKKIEFCVRKIGVQEKENPNFPKIFLSFWRFWGLILTPNLLPCARMDLLDWYFSFSTAHNYNFSFSNEVT